MGLRWVWDYLENITSSFLQVVSKCNILYGNTGASKKSRGAMLNYLSRSFTMWTQRSAALPEEKKLCCKERICQTETEDVSKVQELWELERIVLNF